jgi:hypothetical protein
MTTALDLCRDADVETGLDRLAMELTRPPQALHDDTCTLPIDYSLDACA